MSTEAVNRLNVSLIDETERRGQAAPGEGEIYTSPRRHRAVEPGGPRPSAEPNHWPTRWRAFLNPLDAEKVGYLQKRWAELPAELQTPHQISGRHLTHCGFTTGASFCSFHCTHCYLPKNANEVPIPSLTYMKEQIEANRRFQGPGGGIQVTGGDVADAYWRAGKADELVEVIKHCYKVGLVPMLFTHGQTLIEAPEFLEKLMVEGGLRQVAIHVDMTQAGRHGFPIQRIKSESDLHPIREAFTELGQMMREKTGLPLEFAHNCTVTRRNIEFVPQIVSWFLEKPERTQLWRMVSFQPEADTGRTIFSKEPITPAMVWEKIQEGAGHPLEREATIFGHPDCNSWASILVSQRTGRTVPLLPTEAKSKVFFGKVLSKIGGLSLVTDDAGTAPYRLAGVLAQNFWLALGTVAHLAGMLLRNKPLRANMADLIAGRAHTVGIGMHNFMDAEQVAGADKDPVTKCRLDSCVFKGAVKENGEWQAVPMCQMNQAKWGAIYQERLDDASLPRTSTAPVKSRVTMGGVANV